MNFKVKFNNNSPSFEADFNSSSQSFLADFNYKNGKYAFRSIVEVKKVSSVGLIDTYKIIYNDGTETTYEIRNGSEGKSAYLVAVENGFEGNESEWLISLIGPQGLSAYEVAVKNGFIGTEEEWLDSLKSEGGVAFETDETLSLKDGILSVNTASEPEPDNTLPITAAAVSTTIGNIEILLKTI